MSIVQEFIYFYTDDSFDYGGMSPHYMTTAHGFEIVMDDDTEKADLSTLSAFGMFDTKGFEKFKNDPLGFAEYLEDSKSLLFQGDFEGNVNENLIDVLIEFVKNQFCKVA